MLCKSTIYRFSDRVLITDPKTRKQLLAYAKNGLFSEEMKSFGINKGICNIPHRAHHTHIDKENSLHKLKFHQCHPKFTKFASPAWAPSESAMNLLCQLCDKDIFKSRRESFCLS